MDDFQYFIQQTLNNKETENKVYTSTSKEVSNIHIPVKFTSDIKALESEFGEFKAGKLIELELKDALELMPRERKRSDAYNSLVIFLDNNFGVKLIVKSVKTKKGGA